MPQFDFFSYVAQIFWFLSTLCFIDITLVFIYVIFYDLKTNIRVASFTKIKMWFFELWKLDFYITGHFPKRSKLEVWFLIFTIFLLFFLSFQGKFFPEIFDVHPYVIIFLEVLLSLYVIYRCWVCYFILDTITKPDFVCFETLRFDFHQFVCFTKFVVVIKGGLLHIKGFI